MRWFRDLISAPSYRRFLRSRLSQVEQRNIEQFDKTPFVDRELGAKIGLVGAGTAILALVNDFSHSRSEFEEGLAQADQGTIFGLPGLAHLPRASAAYGCYTAFMVSGDRYAGRNWRAVAGILIDRASAWRSDVEEPE
jgi:hypothetical protein